MDKDQQKNMPETPEDGLDEDMDDGGVDHLDDQPEDEIANTKKTGNTLLKNKVTSTRLLKENEDLEVALVRAVHE